MSPEPLTLIMDAQEAEKARHDEHNGATGVSSQFRLHGAVKILFLNNGITYML